MVTTEAQRPLGVTVLAVLDVLVGIFPVYLGVMYMIFISTFSNPGIIGSLGGWGMPGFFALFRGALILPLGLILLVLGILAFVVGWGFWKGRGWAWTFGLVLYVIGIVLEVISLAVGDVVSIVVVIIGALLVYYMFRPNVKAWFGKA